MRKTPAEPAAKGPPTAASRPRLKLALLALAPLLAVPAGGYACWTMFIAPAPAEAAAAHGDGAGTGAAADAKPSALPPAIAAESSFTHSFALSVLVGELCGDMHAPALQAASAAEARSDGVLVNLSWMAAARRVDLLSAKSCGHFFAEIEDAEARATQIAAGRGFAGQAEPKGH
mgnify:CR=1 FL=1